MRQVESITRMPMARAPAMARVCRPSVMKAPVLPLNAVFHRVIDARAGYHGDNADEEVCGHGALCTRASTSA